MNVTSTVLMATAAATMTALTALPASADVVDKRQAKQAQRIEQGRRTGQLTAYEYWKLKKQQQAIAAKERKFERDGRLTRQEKNKLTNLQNKASKSIYQEKHDAQKSWYSSRRYASGGRYGTSYRGWWGWRPWWAR